MNSSMNLENWASLINVIGLYCYMHPHKYKRKKEKEKNEALKQIKLLFDDSVCLIAKDKATALRNLRKVRRLALKHRIKLPQPIKRRICKHCCTLLVPGFTLRVRTRRKHKQVVYYCMECKKFTKYGYGKKSSMS